MPNIYATLGEHFQISTSDFAKYYFTGYEYILQRYFRDPTEENAIEVANRLSEFHAKSAPVTNSLHNLNLFERVLGKLKADYRGHIIHIINVLFLGVFFFERIPMLQSALLCYPGENVDEKTDNSKAGDIEIRRSVFYYRWIFASLFHDIGYIFELMAQTESKAIIRSPNNPLLSIDPIIIDIEKNSLNNLRLEKIRRQKIIREYAQENRDLPIISLIHNYDDLFPSYHWAEDDTLRKVKEYTDILEHIAYSISKVNKDIHGDKDDNLTILNRTMNESFQVGGEKTFDHGKLSAFMLMHEIRNVFELNRNNKDATMLKIEMEQMRISWQRAIVYLEVVDAATAIYLHNTLRFQLADKWAPYSPFNIPPLSYLLMLCDFLVEWDKPQKGYQPDRNNVDAHAVSIAINNGTEISLAYKDQKKIVEDLKGKINKLFDKSKISIKVEY